MPNAQGDIDVATKLCRIVVHTCTCTFILKEKVWASVETKKWAYLVRHCVINYGGKGLLGYI